MKKNRQNNRDSTKSKRLKTLAKISGIIKDLPPGDYARNIDEVLYGPFTRSIENAKNKKTKN